MKKINYTLFLVVISVLHVLSQPTDNPYKTKYGDVDHWTNQLKWSTIYDATANNIKTSNSASVNSTNIATLINTVSNAGGGVIYFPTGTYNFSTNLILKSGVILRGASITSSANSTSFDPSTNFVFPKNGYKRIGSDHLISDKNIAIVGIDIDKAHILFTGSKWRHYTNSVNIYEKYATVLDQNVLIMYVRINNTGVPQPSTYSANGWCYRMQSHINLYVGANGVVANCRCGDNTTDNSGDFNHNNHYGISMNRLKICIDTVGGYGAGSNFNYALYSYKNNATYVDDPTLFSPGIEVRDNYSKTTMRVKIIAAGQGLILENNVTDDESGKVCKWDPSGTKTPGNSATFENRGIDFSGTHVVVRNNIAKCYQCKLGTSSYPSVDGEGLLAQECCGGTIVNDYLIENNELQGDAGYIGLYKMKDIDNVIIRNNKLNSRYITVTANTNGGTYRINNVIIESNTNVNNISVSGTKGGEPCTSFIRKNSGKGNISFPCHITVENNTGMLENSCTAVLDENEPAISLTLPIATDVKIVNCNTASVNLEASVLCGNFDTVLFVNNASEVLTTIIKRQTKYSYTLNLASGADVKNISAVGIYKGNKKPTRIVQIKKICDVPTFNPIVKKQEELNLIIYQDKDYLNIKSDKLDLVGTNLLLYSLDGKVIKNINLNNSNLNSILINDLQTGVYIIKLMSENNSFSDKLFIIR